MKRMQRLVVWAVGLAVMACVGWAVFFFVRHQPRCVIHARHMLHLSDDGNRLLTSDDGLVQLWDTQRGVVLRTFLDKADGRYTQIMPNKRTLASIANQQLTLLDWQTGIERSLPLPRWAGAQTYLRFSPKGTWMAVVHSSDDQRRYAFVNVDEGKLTLDHEGAFQEFCGEERLVVLGKDGAGGVSTPPALLDLRTGKVVKQWERGPASLAYSPCGKLLAVCTPRMPLSDKDSTDLSLAYAELEVEVWDVSNMTRRLHHVTPPDTCISNVAFTPDSWYLSVAVHGHQSSYRLMLFELSSGKIRFTAPIDCTFFTIEYARDGASGELLCLIDECWIDRPNQQETSSMWSVATGKRLWQRDHQHGARLLSSAGRVLIFPQNEGCALLDAPGGAILAEVPQAYRHVLAEGGDYCLLVGNLRRPDKQGLVQAWLEETWPKLFRGAEKFTVVLRADTGREVFCLEGQPSRDAIKVASSISRARHQHVELSAAGNTLLIVDYPLSNAWVHVPDAEELATSVIMFWDVHPQRAWAWAGASALMTALCLLLLRAGWCRWRGRGASSAVADSASNSGRS